MFHKTFQAYQKNNPRLQGSHHVYIMRWEHFVIFAAEV